MLFVYKCISEFPLAVPMHAGRKGLQEEETWNMFYLTGNWAAVFQHFLKERKNLKHLRPKRLTLSVTFIASCNGMLTMKCYMVLFSRTAKD